MGCFEPLGLAVSIHEDLPFLTDLGNSYQLLSNTTFASVINEGVGEAIDFFLVSKYSVSAIEKFGEWGVLLKHDMNTDLNITYIPDTEASQEFNSRKRSTSKQFILF